MQNIALTRKENFNIFLYSMPFAPNTSNGVINNWFLNPSEFNPTITDNTKIRKIRSFQRAEYLQSDRKKYKKEKRSDKYLKKSKKISLKE